MGVVIGCCRNPVDVESNYIAAALICAILNLNPEPSADVVDKILECSVVVLF
jgi:hypothetical protein